MLLEPLLNGFWMVPQQEAELDTDQDILLY